MKSRVLPIGILFLTQVFAAEPLHVIFDTDIGNDIDDALALAMLHAFMNRGEVDLRAVTITKDNRWAPAFVSLVNDFYGRSEIPIGMVKNGKTPEDSAMLRVPAELRDGDGNLVYPRNIDAGDAVPEATALLRRILASEKNGAVTIIQVGFSTNLARLLDSPADDTSALTGKELVRRKVRMLCVMAGHFPSGEPEFNVKTDIPSAQKIFTEWPTSIVVSGFEIGKAILYPATSILQDFAYTDHHPVADAYKSYQTMPYDRPTWDLTAVLFAVRPERGYFEQSLKGRVRVDATGKTKMEYAADGRHRFLVLRLDQIPRIREAMTLLASEAPRAE